MAISRHSKDDEETVLNSSAHREEIILEVEIFICPTHYAVLTILSLSPTFIEVLFFVLLEVATEHQEIFLIFYYCFCSVSKLSLSLVCIIKHALLQRLAN